MKTIFGLSFRYIKKNIHRSITTAIGIMLSTVIIYLIFCVGYSGFDTLSEQKYEDSMGWDAMYICDYETAEEILTLVPYYKKTPAVDATDFQPSHGFYICTDSVYSINYINDFDAMPVKYKLKYGDYPKNGNEQFVSLRYAREFKWSVGNTYEYFYVVVNEPDGELIRKSKNITISGIYEDINYEPDDDVTYPVEIWNSVLYGKMTPEITENIAELQLYITFENKDNIENQAAKLASAFGIDDYKINDAALNAFAEQNKENTITYLAVEALLLILATLGSMCTMFIVRNAFNISVHQRNMDYGILRCIGMDRKQIIKVIIIEAMLLSIIGIGVGILAGHGLAVVGFRFIKKTFGYSQIFRARFYVKALVLTIIYSLISTCYAMVAPIEKLYRFNPVEALTYKDEYKNKKTKSKRGTLLTKIFGFEVGYAYKNVQRRKGRFLINIFTLFISVFLFIAFSNIYSYMNKYIDKYVLSKNIYDGYFAIENYEEARILQSELEERDFTQSIFTFNQNIVYRDDLNIIDKIYLGLDKTAFDKIKDKSNIYTANSEQNVINVIITDNLTGYEPGETYSLTIYPYNYENSNADAVTYNFCIKGIIPEDEFLEVIKEYDIYDERDRGKNAPHVIYMLGGTFDGINGYADEFTTFSTDCRVKIDLKDLSDTEEFDEYVNNVLFTYYDEHYSAMQVYNTIKTGRMIIDIFILLILLVYLTNIININKADYIIRKKEFQILRHIGMSQRQHNKILLSENFIAGCIALIFGCILGTITGNIICYYILLLLEAEPYICIDYAGIIICVIAMFIFNTLTTLLSKVKE